MILEKRTFVVDGGVELCFTDEIYKGEKRDYNLQVVEFSLYEDLLQVHVSVSPVFSPDYADSHLELNFKATKGGFDVIDHSVLYSSDERCSLFPPDAFTELKNLIEKKAWQELAFSLYDGAMNQLAMYGIPF